MTRWITKKDRKGRNKHVPIEQKGRPRNTGVNELPQAVLRVRPEREVKRLTGDMEYLGNCRSPAMGLEAARRHVLGNELKAIPLKDIKEEEFYYDSKGHGVGEDYFYRHGGSFDYIAEGSEGGKYMVNATVERKGSRWRISGIGNWLREPKKEEHLYREGAEEEERKKFEQVYGKKRGDYIYGATVGKVRMEREERARKRAGGE